MKGCGAAANRSIEPLSASESVRWVSVVRQHGSQCIAGTWETLAPALSCITGRDSARTAMRWQESVTIDDRRRLVHDASSDHVTMSALRALRAPSSSPHLAPRPCSTNLYRA